MLYFVCENARDMKQPNLLPVNEFTEENLKEKKKFNNDMGFKKFKNVNISIKLHSFNVRYSICLQSCVYP